MRNVTLALALVACLGISAHASNPPVPNAPAVANANPAPYANLDFYGANHYSLGVSTPADIAVQFFSGAGLLYGISCTSGTAGDFETAFDSAPTLAGLQALTANDTKGLSPGPSVLTSANGSTACTGQAVCGSWTPGRPVRLANGLAAIKHGPSASGGNTNCVFLALPDSVTSAASH